jgi:hypothetical protein
VSSSPGFVEDWTPVRADRASEDTARSLRGEVVSRARVVGNRSTEAIIADRERRLEEMRQRALTRDRDVA